MKESDEMDRVEDSRKEREEDKGGFVRDIR